jgi:hypothetical protein
MVLYSKPLRGWDLSSNDFGNGHNGCDHCAYILEEPHVDSHPFTAKAEP